MKKLILFSLAFVVGLSIQAQQTVKKSFSGIKEIDLSTGSGDIILKKGGNEVQLELTYTYDDDEYEPEIEQKGDRLILSEEFKGRGSYNGYSKWALTIPNGLEVDVNTGSGDITADNLQIELTSNSGSGDVEGQALSGEITTNAGSGDVNLNDFDGELKVNAGSGNVELDNSNGSFKVNLGSGDVQASDVQGGFSINVGSGDIELDDVIIADRSSFNAGSGDVEVSLAGDLQSDISVNSGSGDAKLDFNGSKLAGEFTMKANKKHGEISAPFTFDKVEEEKSGSQTIVKKTASIGNSDIEINIGTGSGRAIVEK